MLTAPVIGFEGPLPPDLSRAGQRDDLTCAERVWIIGRHRQGTGADKIADEIKSTARTVWRVLRDPEATYALHRMTLPVSRRRLLDEQGFRHGRRRRHDDQVLEDEDLSIIAMVLRNPALGPAALARRMGGDWTRERVKYLLTRYFPYERAVQRPPLSDDMMAERLKWFLFHEPTLSVDDVVWSDESYIRRTGNSFRWSALRGLEFGGCLRCLGFDVS
jgi:hypothetical protein